MIAILNSLWPSAAVTAIAFLALCRARLDAATRFVIWWLVLIAILALPLVPRPVLHRAAALAPAPAQASAPALERYRRLPPVSETVFDAPLVIEQPPAASWPKYLFLAWACLSSIKVVRLIGAYVYLRRLRRRSILGARPLPAQPRGVRLLVSDEISSPIAIGFLRPAILVPPALANHLSDAEMDHVLLHEAAHIARRDDWTTLAARLIAAVFALHPFALWILSRIEQDREMACDDWAVARTGAARSYAESLAQVCELSRQPSHALLAAGVLGRKSRIRQRIEHLLAARVFRSRASLPRLMTSAAVLAALILAVSVAPRWIAFAQRPEFEVASIKLNKVVSPNIDTRPKRSGDLVTMHNTRLFTMIYFAYHLTGNFQLAGNMDAAQWWDWYDLDARAPAATTEDQLRLMMQALLEDRFNLKVHRETRELSAFHIVIAKGGPKLKPEGAGLDFKVDGRMIPLRPGVCAPLLSRDGTHLGCKGGTILQFAAILRGEMGGPVVDDTGLTGKYDFELVYQRPNAPPANLPDDIVPAPPIAEAIQSLGLRLEKGKAPVEVLVVDHSEKPSAN